MLEKSNKNSVFGHQDEVVNGTELLEIENEKIEGIGKKKIDKSQVLCKYIKVRRQ